MRTLISLLSLSLLVTACDQPAPKKAPETKTPAVADGAKKDAPKKKAQADNKQESVILGVGKTPADIEPGKDHVYGARFTIIEKPITLAKAISDIDKHTGPIKVEARVEKVCQKKGCWFSLKSEGVKETIRVTMKDYKFFVPRNAMGLPAELEGTLVKKEIPQKDAQHYANDEVEGTGKPAAKIEGPQVVYSFTATAVRITRPGA